MASADGWTTFPAERQGAVIEMRAGQRGGPLPFEASFDFGERIIKTKVTAKRWLHRTRDINSGVFCNRVCVTLKSRKPFLDKENREGGANNLVFEFRGNQTDAPDERGRRIERETHVRINDAAQRRTWTKHQPIRVLRLRAASLLEGVQTQQTQAMSTNDGTLVGDATGALLLEGFAAQRTHGIIQSPGSNDASSTLQMKFFQRTMVTMLHTLMSLRVHVPDQTMGSSVFHAADLMSNESRGKPAQVLLLRAASPRAGEAQVEAEGDEVTLPVVEPMTAATLCGVFGTEYTSRAQAEAIWSEPITTDL